MGKTSKRPGRAARDVHEAIRLAALALKTSGRNGLRNAAEFPEVDALLRTCREAVAVGIPRFVQHKGRTYWLRVRIGATFEVFAAPGDAEPLVVGASFSSDEHGHRPGH